MRKTAKQLMSQLLQNFITYQTRYQQGLEQEARDLALMASMLEALATTASKF